ncbi:MAG: radical SAM protein [Candidatus Eisenbacteria bacterium]|nr:radical SAM protein [Candidatus Eisenbacteria bacterium]
MRRRGRRSARSTARGSPRELPLDDHVPSGAESFSIALVYPATYPLGMSNLGFHAALRAARALPDVRVERAFWDKRGSGTTHESGLPLSSFDVVAFSTSFEDDFLRIPAMLSSGGVAVETAERRDGPVVVMGGFCAALNPEPVAPLLDAVLIGDAPALVPELVERLMGTVGRPREERLVDLAGMEGAYVPSLYRVVEEDGVVKGFESLQGAPLPVRPAPPSDELASSVILSDEAHFEDMFMIETARGCARGCRFCAAGSLGRPVRVHEADRVIAAALDALDSTRRIGLVSASLGDHPEIVAIATALVEAGAELNIASIRAESLTPAVAEVLAAAGTRTVTIAPEAGSLELRRIIGKPTPVEALKRAAAVLADAGIPRLKLYFMVGLPGEEDRDIAAISELTAEMVHVFASGRSGARVSVGASPFVPKPRTPFQWVPAPERRVVRDRITKLRRALARTIRIPFTSAGPREAEREAVLARGGRSMAPAIRSAGIDRVPFRAALKRSGIDIRDALARERTEDETFPWEVVEAGPPKQELLDSYRSARNLIERRR